MTTNQPPLNIERLREARNQFIKEVIPFAASDAIQKIATSPLYPNMTSELMISQDLHQEETEIATQIIQSHRETQSPQIITRDFLLLSTLLPSYMIPILPDLEYVPDSLIVHVLELLLKPMSVFITNSDMEQKAFQILMVHHYVAKRIIADPHSEYTSACADLILKAKDTYVCLNLKGWDLKDFSEDRAKIFNYILDRHGLVSKKQITGGNPIIGVLISHVGGDDSTLYGLQILKDLKAQNLPSLLICDSTASMSVQKQLEHLATRTLLLPKGIKAAIELIKEQNLEFLILTDPLHDAEHPAFLLATHQLAKHQIALQNTIITSGFTTTKHLLIDDSLIDDISQCDENLHGIVNLTKSLTVDLVNVEDAEKPTRESIGLSSEEKVFVSAAPMHSITPEVRTCWINIIKQCPNSKLLLLPFHDENISEKDRDAFKTHFEYEASNQNVNRSNILILTDTVPNIQTIDNYVKLTDCYLDTFPCNSLLAVARALSCNIPIITIEGNQFREKVSKSGKCSHQTLVHACKTIDQYIGHALECNLNDRKHHDSGIITTNIIKVLQQIK